MDLTLVRPSIQVMDTISSWRGRFKISARLAVQEHYGINVPDGKNQDRSLVKERALLALQKGNFIFAQFGLEVMFLVT